MAKTIIKLTLRIIIGAWLGVLILYGIVLEMLWSYGMVASNDYYKNIFEPAFNFTRGNPVLFVMHFVPIAIGVIIGFIILCALFICILMYALGCFFALFPFVLNGEYVISDTFDLFSIHKHKREPNTYE